MKNFKISVLFLFLTIFSLPVLADDALLSELIRLDEERRAEIKTLYIEWNYSQQVDGDVTYKYESLGNVWERLGIDKYRHRTRLREFRINELEEELACMMNDVSVDPSLQYELRVPYEKYPVNEPLNLCEFYDNSRQGYLGRITKNPSDVRRGMPYPFFGLPIPDFDVLSPSRESPFRELFEEYTPARVEKIQNDAGDEVVQVELSGAAKTPRKLDRWSITIDFNLSKGGLVSKYFCVRTAADGSARPDHNEGLAKRFEESKPGSGHWYPQEFQVVYYLDPAIKTTNTRTITNYTLNEKSENQLGPVQFPEGLVVYESDQKTDKLITHIWGKNKSEKKFTDEDEFHEYFAKHCSFGPYAFQEAPKSVSSIRIALLLLGALLIAAGLYMRRRRGEV